MRAAALLLFVVASSAHAQALVTAIVDASNLTDAQVKKVQRASESTLKQLTNLTVGEGPAFHKGSPRRCDGDCARELVRSLRTTGALLLELKSDGRGQVFQFEAQLWLDGERVGSKRGEGSLEAAEASLKPVLEGLTPAWARKGWGALKLDVERGSVVKVDGRKVGEKAGETVAVPAGPHQVDVLFPDGHAVLQRLEVAEGARERLEVQSPAEAVEAGAPTQGFSALRASSYAVFMAGAATLAGGLIAGALSRNTSAGLTPCRGDSRDCASLDTVLERNRQAASLATAGNVLLGVGGGLVVVGAGLFVVDAVAP